VVCQSWHRGMAAYRRAARPAGRWCGGGTGLRNLGVYRPSVAPQPERDPSDLFNLLRTEVILWAVRWTCRYGVSYRALGEMMCARGVSVDHTTIYRWVQWYAPEMEKRLRWYWRPTSSIDRNWYVDETYIKVKGRWACLYRAIDEQQAIGCS
jgi:hypothetical protein